MYKIETHLHTHYASSCSKLDEKQIVDGFLAAGYHGVVITDHYHRNTKWFCFSEKPDLVAFLQGYEKVKEEGRRRGLRVYRGAEVRFDGDPNDYLVYGFSDALLARPEKIFEMGLQAFSELARQDGALLVQAHPCRHSPYEICRPAPAAFLDGVEIFNGNPAADNRNMEASAFAMVNPQLIRLSGTDCHNTVEIGLSGILMERLPENDREFVEMLKERQYSTIR